LKLGSFKKKVTKTKPTLYANKGWEKNCYEKEKLPLVQTNDIPNILFFVKKSIFYSDKLFF